MSRSTVSRVLTGSPLVSDAAREAVERAIAKLNYVPNRAAQALASNRTRSIVLLVPENIGKFFADPFFAPVIAGIDAELRESDFVFTMFIASRADDQKAVNYLSAEVAEGVIVLSHHVADAFVEKLRVFLPVIFGGRPRSPAPGDYYVDVDNVAGGALATQHLVDRGYRHIAAITAALDQPYAVDRLEGFNVTLQDAGLIPAGIADGQSTYQGGFEAMRELLAAGPVDAVFAASDLMARGACDYLLTNGYAIPSDVAVIGFDDSGAATASEPHLTTVRQPLREMGRTLARTLVELLEGEVAPTRTLLPVELVQRETT